MYVCMYVFIVVLSDRLICYQILVIKSSNDRFLFFIFHNIGYCFVVLDEYKIFFSNIRMYGHRCFYRTLCDKTGLFQILKYWKQSPLLAVIMIQLISSSFFRFYPHIICVLLLFRMVSFHRNIARKEFARVQTASVSVQNGLLVVIQCYHNHSCYKITPYTVYVQYTCNSSDYSIKYEILQHILVIALLKRQLILYL